MASTEIVVLHSSPPHQQRDKEPVTTPPPLHYVPNSSSSDGSSLPSVSKLWKKWDPKQKEAGSSRVSPLPHGSRLKDGLHASALPTTASFGFQNVKSMVGSTELSIEEGIVDVRDGKSTGGKPTSVKEIGDAAKLKEPSAPAKTKTRTKSKPGEDPGTEKGVKTKAKRTSRAKVATINTEGTVSNHFEQGIERQRIGAEKPHDTAKEEKAKAKRKPRAKPVVSTHFDQNNAIETSIGRTAVPITNKRKRKNIDDTEEKSKSIQHASQEGDAKAPKSRNKTGKASTHFTIEDVSGESRNKTSTKAVSIVPESHEPLDIAEKRKKSWTPVPDTVPAQLKLRGHDIYEVPSSSQPPTPVGAKPDFRSMIGSFGFDSRSDTRSTSPEKVDIVGWNKRRRIELIDDTILAPTESASTTNAPDILEPKVATAKQAKKKSPKKAAFSITNKVIDKYARPVIENTSIFFAPRVEPPVKAAGPKKAATLVKTKKAPRARPKGPIKPRASKKAAEEGTKVVKSKAKAKTSKPKKVIDMGQKLISPSGIASRTEQQNVMFGTSSQLLTGDSPNTLRQLRDALRESEMMTSIEEEPTCTAPVHRRLARGIRHTSGKLWARQAESFDENSTASELPNLHVSRGPNLPVATEERANNFDLPRANIEPVDLMPLQCTDHESQTLSDEIEAMDFDNDLESPSNQGVRAGGFMPTQSNLEDRNDSNWYDVSSAQALLEESLHNHKPRQPGLEERDASQRQTLPSTPALPEDETQIEPMQYSFAEEESPDWHDLSFSAALAKGHDSIGLQKSPSTGERTTKLTSKRAAAAPAMRSSLFASVVPSASRTALRPLSTNTKSHNKSSPSNKVTTKSAAVASNGAAFSPKKKRGRLPKSKTIEEKPTLVLQSTPKKQNDTADEWHDINDEIMDSDPDMTPSPRRRGKKAPPSPLPDLVSNAIEAVTKRSNGALANANHPQWPEIQAKLFPDITLVVKGQTRSLGGQKLTWYEKMLMYDPIVIEDLTAFVNAEGLRITIKEKEEDIRGWMVQKWCEDNSVCCLWKEGLRGGVKTKY
ncbi:hypothetical protein EG327_011349 [Venturia inaequalis]|uniref:Structure-specific endonuclease subunit SLX4 n=1 Tax=Venturia inaequalis TaxID=5025 RepID=A0A8H3VPH8_VENIN|nr:hypothetical protein EG327_011349 [Venturia inaequalis]